MLPTTRSLYDPAFEHDACGVGFVADILGRPSHLILARALEAVVNLTHRGAVAADARTGDGAGVLTQIPRPLFARELERLGYATTVLDDLGVGMIFLPQDPGAQERCREIVQAEVQRAGLIFLGWRPVPVDPSVLGERARATLPDIQQALVARPRGLSDEAYERRLYLVRKRIERAVAAVGIRDCYIPSFSHRTIVYKGLFVAPQLRGFYRDLADPAFTTALAVFHQRYSTNTFPNWFLAQPFRLLAHNGEINTLQGNRNWMRAREAALASPVWGEAIADLTPIVWEEGSDSASLDNVLELLRLSGRDLLHAMMMLVPEAWERMPDMDPEWRAFYEYHACLMEPWDGPAALAFSDGVVVGACLDRNGLRPSRYKVTDDGLVVVASEVGVFDLDDAHVVEKGRLGPGQMIAVDTARRVLLKNEQIKQMISRRRPYGQWVQRHLFRLSSVVGGPNGHLHPDTLPLWQRQQAFGFTNEELQLVVKTMGYEGKDPVWSMGDDAPIAVLSRKPRLVYHFLKQRFAQVTNPPIDPLREEIVMALDVYIGARRSLLEETAEHAKLVHLPSPVLRDDELEALKHLPDPAFQAAVLPAVFDRALGPEGLKAGLQALCQAAEAAVDAGKTILILTDRPIGPETVAIPMLLAVGAVHHHLIRVGKRMRADIVVETGQAWEVHHFATLIGYGASAINPYLAYQTVADLVLNQGVDGLPLERALENYRHAVEAGLLKIMSKMGISTLTSYRGAQIFEAIGLGPEVIETCFVGTPSRVGGIGLREFGEDALARHRLAFGPDPESKLPDYGFYRYRRDGEYHGYNPRIVRQLQKAARSGSYEEYKLFAQMVYEREPALFRDLLRFRRVRDPIPLDEVEPMEKIRQRFVTQAMSLGALSPEAHETISIAMNRIGCRSNTGEGGEDPEWYKPRPNGDSANNKIKQVASGRFGVTPEYLAHAEEIEIKMAQGSKPGEGGQLPGHKVTELIARLRHAVPGIQLISPPPHHDIYSIEDLAQLIYDLKQVNPRARVGVKLVSESGVGTIAAGVAKAYADYVLISGDSGGTGASPLSSIKNAGCPWELGLAETQQVLVLNDLRGRLRVRTDGGLKTGRDVVYAALLGAEEFGFGTAALVSIGCDMARQCHLNTCPTGIATQRPDLRARYEGTPEMLINYLTFVAMEVREILADLGFRSLDEIIGRTDLLEPVEAPPGSRAATLDLRPLLADVDPSGTRPRRCVQARNDRPESEEEALNPRILADARPALENGTPVRLRYQIRNCHRTVGATLAGEIARRYGLTGLPDGTIEIEFEGSAGQSFGAFTIRGMRLILTGEANDYVGKGMAGGEIIIKPPKTARFASHENVIVGNTVLYGATGGALFVAGRAGERFCVRNSGALAVVEGTGDHCCEYMTAGMTVVLGETGRNFGAGMSNGVAYVLDEKGVFPRRYNPEMISIERLSDPEDIALLKSVIQRHWELTGSERARTILENWAHYEPLFWKVVPHPPVTTQQSGTVMVVSHGRSGQPRH